MGRLPIRAWSPQRKALSAAALVAVLALSGVVAWRATLNPLQLWDGAEQCSTLPGRDVGQLYGLALSRDLQGAPAIDILQVETATGWSGAAAPTYWIVPVTNGSGGTGSAVVTDPPPHWNQRRPATGAHFAAANPANIVIELSPRHGHALLTGVTVTYRTPDGFIHTAASDVRDEVDTSGRCAHSTNS